MCKAANVCQELCNNCWRSELGKENCVSDCKKLSRESRQTEQGWGGDTEECIHPHCAVLWQLGARHTRKHTHTCHKSHSLDRSKGNKVLDTGNVISLIYCVCAGSEVLYKTRLHNGLCILPFSGFNHWCYSNWPVTYVAFFQWQNINPV